MCKHTPGPWQAHHDNGCLYVESDNGDMYIKIEKGSADGKHMGNACLIAAAPDLLKILKRLEKKYGCNGDGWPNKEFDDVRKVISKATGKG